MTDEIARLKTALYAHRVAVKLAGSSTVSRTFDDLIATLLAYTENQAEKFAHIHKEDSIA